MGVRIETDALVLGAGLDCATLRIHHAGVGGGVVVTGHVAVSVAERHAHELTLTVRDLGRAGWIFCTAYSGGARTTLTLAGLGSDPDRDAGVWGFSFASCVPR